VLAVTIGQTSGALKVFRLSLAATGIGAAVIALGLLIANFEQVVDWVKKLIPGLDMVGKFFGKIVDSITDFVGITSEGGRALEDLTKKNEKVSQTLNAQIKIWEAVGGKEKEIFEAKKQLINDELNLLRQRLKVNGELSVEELKRFKELKNDLIIEEVNYNKKVEEVDKKAEEDRKKRVEERNKSNQAIKDAQIRGIADDNKRELAAFDEKLKREIESAVNNEK
jgi:hypothetical protein